MMMDMLSTGQDNFYNKYYNLLVLTFTRVKNASDAPLYFFQSLRNGKNVPVVDGNTGVCLNIKGSDALIEAQIHDPSTTQPPPRCTFAL